MKHSQWWKLLKAVVMCGCPCCLELALELEMEGPYFLVTEMVPLLIWEESKKGSETNDALGIFGTWNAKRQFRSTIPAPRYFCEPVHHHHGGQYIRHEMILFVKHIRFYDNGGVTVVSDMAGDTDGFSRFGSTDEIHGHGYSNHGSSYGCTGDTGDGIGQGSQHTAMEAAPVIVVLQWVCLQADGDTAAVNFINVDMEIIFHEPVFLINVPDVLPDFLRISELFYIGIHHGPILFSIVLLLLMITAIVKDCKMGGGIDFSGIPIFLYNPVYQGQAGNAVYRNEFLLEASMSGPLKLLNPSGAFLYPLFSL